MDGRFKSFSLPQLLSRVRVAAKMSQRKNIYFNHLTLERFDSRILIEAAQGSVM
jgi:hypothetical protein